MELMKGYVSVKNNIRSNVVRIFVSSTFSDMSQERNILYNYAYPELQTFCQSLGLDFQVIDMRWGVRDTATVDHSTTSLCILEVQTCKRLSIGPYFAVLLGNRYGYQPLPTEISGSDFTIVKTISDEEGLDEEGMLEQWYIDDNNSTPPVKILEPITRYFPNFDNVDPDFQELRKTEQKKWMETFGNLTYLLKRCSQLAVQRGLFKKDSNFNFHSVTHMEVDEALKAKEDKKLFAYYRDISDIAKHSKDEMAKKFVDVSDDGEVDSTRQKLLRFMRKKVKYNTEGMHSFRRYNVKWMDISNSFSFSESSFSSEGSYLGRICSDFISDVKQAVTQSVNKTATYETEDGESRDFLLEEIIHHANFADNKASDFCGRARLLADIAVRIRNKENHQPIMIVGSSGSGKTSLMARLIFNERGRSSKPTIIYRFLGTSPECCSIHKMLKSLILQISRVHDEKVPASHLLENITDVVDIFSKLLQTVSNRLKVEENGELLIFLDAVDQLLLDDGAYRMTWLPKIIPPRVTIVLSSLPEPDFDIVPTMRRYLPESNEFALHPLNEETGREILHKWLAGIGRCLTSVQTDKIMSAFVYSSYPLYLKLMFAECKRWRSDYNVDELVLPGTTRTAISQFYERLEREHGRTFVSHTVAFIVAARDGVTENELLDLLSLDDEVLYDVYEHWPPPSENIVRIPSFTWTRLRYDFGEYLVERQATGHTVLSLYHRQFIEVARERYFQSDDKRKTCKLLAQYFGGKFAEGRKKKLKLKMWNDPREVDRKVANQPLQFSRGVFNVRKLRELPFSLLGSESWKKLSSNILCNATWMQAKIQAFSIKELLDDYDLALQLHPDPEIDLIRDAIKLAKPTLEFEGGIKNHLFTEIFGRLAFFVDEFPHFLGSLVEQCRRYLVENQKEKFLPLTGCFQPPGGPLRSTITALIKSVTYVASTKDGELLAAGSLDGFLIVWDIIHDEVIHRMDEHMDAISCIAFEDESIRMSSSSRDGIINVYDLDNGSVISSLSNKQVKASCFVSLLLIDNTLLCTTDKYVDLYDISSRCCIYSKEMTSDVTCMTALMKEMVMIGRQDGNCVFVDVQSGLEQQSLQHPNNNSSPIMTIYAMKSKEKILVVWKDGTSCLTEYNASKENILAFCKQQNAKECAVANDENLFAVAFSDVIEVFSLPTPNNLQIEVVGILDKHSSVITRIRFVAADVLAVGYQNKRVILWRIHRNLPPSKVNEWIGMGASIDYLEICGHVGVTASSQVFYLKLWNVQHEKVNRSQTTFDVDFESGAISPCGTYSAYAKESKVYIKVIKESIDNFTSLLKYNISEKFTKICVDNFKHIKNMFFTRHGEHLLVMSETGMITQIPNPLINAEQGTHMKFKHVDSSLYNDIIHISISNNGKYIGLVAISKSKSKSFELMTLDSTSLKVLGRIFVSESDVNGEISCAHLTNDNEKMIVGTSQGSINIFNMTSEDSTQEWRNPACTVSQHKNAITCLTSSYDCKTLFSGSTGRTRRMWKFENENLKLKHEFHFDSLLEAGVTCARFTNDDRYIITGSKERCIKVWDTETGCIREVTNSVHKRQLFSGLLQCAQYVYAAIPYLVVLENNVVLYTTEICTIAVAQFRPMIESNMKRSYQSHGKNKSSTCSLM